MKRLPFKTSKQLQSSAINTINYSEEKKILEIEYVNETVYWYMNVPLSMWKKFLSLIEKGESAGEFVNKEIKPKYLFEEQV